MSFVPLEINSEYFSYERLVDNGNEYCLRRFAAINEATGITNYFRNQAFKDEKDFSVRNYVVKLKGTEVLVACFSLKCGSIPYNEKVIDLKFTKETKLVPGLELVNIALNDYSLGIIKGLDIKVGRNIFYDIVQPIVKHISQEVGTKVLYLSRRIKNWPNIIKPGVFILSKMKLLTNGLAKIGKANIARTAFLCISLLLKSSRTSEQVSKTCLPLMRASFVKIRPSQTPA